MNFHTISERHIEGPERRWAEEPGLVPILPMPPSGTGEMMVRPMFDVPGAWDTYELEPVTLPSGPYDISIFYWCVEDEHSEEEERWCATTTVDVDGDTVLPLPDLEPCP